MALLICQACSAQLVLIGPEDMLLLSALTLVFLAGIHVPSCCSASTLASFLFKPLGSTRGQFGSLRWRGGPTGLVLPISNGPLVQPACTCPGTCSVMAVIKSHEASIFFRARPDSKLWIQSFPQYFKMEQSASGFNVFLTAKYCKYSLTSTVIKKKNKLRLQTIRGNL